LGILFPCPAQAGYCRIIIIVRSKTYYKTIIVRSIFSKIYYKTADNIITAYNQATSQANACGNGFLPENVFCQNIGSQVQGDENAVALDGFQSAD
jgi:hypothetical protein